MASRFWVNGTGTWNSTNIANWAATTGSTAAGASVPSSVDSVTFDGASGGGTVTVNTTVVVSSMTMGAFTGTLDFSANDNNVTVTQFSGSGTGIRTLNMGDGTWTITSQSASTPWDMNTTTNLTFNSNASTLVIAAQSAPTSQRLINLGASLTYNAITVSDPTIVSTAVHRQLFFTNVSNTITTFAITNAYYIRFPGGTTTITNGFTYTGASSAILLLNGGDGNTASTLSVGGAVVLGNVAIQNIIKTGAGSITATNSYDLGGNADITISAPAAGGGGGVIGG